MNVLNGKTRIPLILLIYGSYTLVLIPSAKEKATIKELQLKFH